MWLSLSNIHVLGKQRQANVLLKLIYREQSTQGCGYEFPGEVFGQKKDKNTELICYDILIICIDNDNSGVSFGHKLMKYYPYLVKNAAKLILMLPAINISDTLDPHFWDNFQMSAYWVGLHWALWSRIFVQDLWSIRLRERCPRYRPRYMKLGTEDWLYQ